MAQDSFDVEFLDQTGAGWSEKAFVEWRPSHPLPVVGDWIAVPGAPLLKILRRDFYVDPENGAISKVSLYCKRVEATDVPSGTPA